CRDQIAQSIVRLGVLRRVAGWIARNPVYHRLLYAGGQEIAEATVCRSYLVRHNAFRASEYLSPGIAGSHRETTHCGARPVWERRVYAIADEIRADSSIV